MKLEEMLSLLKKFNQNWFDYPISHYDKSLEFLDMPEIPFFNKTTINKLPHEIKYLYNQRVFQRLNYIKQLSFIYLFYLGGCHTRLEHTLGTLIIGQKFLKSVRKNNQKVKIRNYEELGLYAALFIHDSCHGPFGHSLELIKKNLIPDDTTNERIDKILLKKYLRNSKSSIRIALNKISPIDPTKFVNFIISLFDMTYNDKVFLIEILNSLVDADRLDYIPRDRYHIGLTSNINLIRIKDLISNVKIIDKWENYKNKLLFSSMTRPIIDNVIDERAHMYNQYYHGEKSKIADTILPHVIYQFLDYFELLINYSALAQRDLKIEILNEILKLSDQDFVRFINFVGEPWYAIELLNNLLTGKIYHKVDEWNIFNNIETTRKELKLISELVNENAKKKGVNLFEKDFKIKMDLHKEVFEKKQDLKFETYLFHFITNCVKEIQGKIFAIERDFWNSLIKHNHDIPNTILQNFGGVAADETLKKFLKIPQVLIALPNYFPTFEEVIKYNFHPKEGEKSFPTLLYDPMKKMDKNNIEKYFEKRPMPKQVKSYSLYLLVPDYLIRFKDLISQEFKSYIKSMQWWVI